MTNPYPMFYMMTPTFGSAKLDVVCIQNGHNINVLLGMKRQYPQVSFVHCSAREAYDFLDSHGGIGIGCFIQHWHTDEERLRRHASKAKQVTFASHAKGWAIKPSLAVADPRKGIREVVRELLTLKL